VYRAIRKRGAERAVQIKIREEYWQNQTEESNSTFPAINSIESPNALTGIATTDRAAVVALAQKLYPLIMERIEHFGVCLPVRVPAVALSSAAMLPQTSPEVLTELGVFLMIIFAIDDLADGLIITGDSVDLSAFLERCSQVVEGADMAVPPAILEPSPDEPILEQVLTLLGECCGNLQKLSSANSVDTQQVYYRLFKRRFKLLMQSMQMELNWQHAFKASGAHPNLAEYLLNGQESIASPTVLAGLLIMMGQDLDQPTGSHAELFSLIETVSLYCGASIRLINDIGGFKRELAEGKPNSVLILMWERQLTEQAAKGEILKAADWYLRKLTQIVATSLPATLQPWGDAVVRLTNFCRDYYLAHEFYEFSPEKLAKLAAS
jgi:hypothetical protein